MSYQVKITPNGRMSLPAELRKRLGLSDGGALFIHETPDGLVLRTAAQSVARAQAIAHQYLDPSRSLVDDFLAFRRTDSGE
jgi:AbrB family looped-hinge helix DNA binding protein